MTVLQILKHGQKRAGSVFCTPHLKKPCGLSENWFRKKSLTSRATFKVTKPLVLKAGNTLIPFSLVKEVRISDIESEIVDIETLNGDLYTAEGFDAIEAVM